MKKLLFSLLVMSALVLSMPSIAFFWKSTVKSTSTSSKNTIDGDALGMNVDVEDDQESEELDYGTQDELEVTDATNELLDDVDQGLVVRPAKTYDTAQDFDQKAKEQAVLDLVEKGIAYIKSHTPDQAFAAFTNDKNFVKGELYLFVFDTKGTCLAHGQQQDLLWKNMYNERDTYGSPFVQNIIERGRAGGDWVTYQWRNSTKRSYVKEVRKGDKSYIVGTGYYPHSKHDAVVTLVKGAVALFNDVVKQGRAKDEAFSTLSYPLGRFIFGDLYLYALDFNGLQLAHGELPGIVGTNAWNYKDAEGKLVNQEIIAKLKDVDFGTGVWVEYISKNALKRAYAEKVVDETGKLYFIACGYYPDANRDQAVELVRRGYRYVKGVGESVAAKAFTDKNDDSFRYGDLFLFMYDMNGICIAHGSNASLVGRDMINAQDEDGFFYVREMIKKAKQGGGWVDYKEKNSFKSAYVEKVNLGVKELVIGSGVHPITKRETMIQLSKSGADYLKNHTPEDSFREFSKLNGKFIRGDLNIFVVDTAGICVVDGDNYDMIWKSLMNAQDDTGKPYITFMINTAQRGSGLVTYNILGATRINFVEPVNKGSMMYVVSSGYFA